MTAEETQENNEPIKPKTPTSDKSVRTYEGDALEALRGKNISLGGVFTAEAKKREETGDFSSVDVEGDKTDKKRVLMVSLIVLFALASILLIGFTIYQKISPEEDLLPPSVETLLPADLSINLDVSENSPGEIISALVKARDEAVGSLGKVTSINLFSKDASGREIFLEATDFLESISSRASGRFLRSLLPEFFIGVHIFDGNQPFIVFKIDSYESAFAGMLDFEPYLKNDLSKFFESKVGIILNPTGDSATTSENIVEEKLPLAPKSFEDLVVRNKDTRVLRNEDGQVILMYSFANQETLVITTNENTFREALDRLSAGNLRN